MAVDAADAPLSSDSEGGERDSALPDSPACPASCDDQNSCTDDSCDTATGQCTHVNLADNTPCQGRPCTTNSICQGGLCLDGPYKVCRNPPDACHVVGVCSPATGDCAYPNAPEGTPCDDGKNYTYGDQCRVGLCVGTPSQCFGDGSVWDPDAGRCTIGFPNVTTAWSLTGAYWPTSGGALARAPDGQLFLAGSYAKQIDLGSGAIIQADQAFQRDLFLAKLDPSTLKATWAVTFPGPGVQDVTSFAVDGSGHIGIIGNLVGGIMVGGEELDAVYTGDQYIISANAADGSARWAKRLILRNPRTNSASASVANLRTIAGDPRGSSFLVCGTALCSTFAQGDAGIDPNPAKDLGASLSCAGGTDLVVARFGNAESADGGVADGAALWADEIGGVNDENCTALAMDGDSNSYIAGTYRFGSEVTFANSGAKVTTLPIMDQANNVAWTFLAKLGPDNLWKWARSIGAGAQSVTTNLLAAVDQDLVVVGTATGQQPVLGMATNSPSFIARFSGANGDLLWVAGLGTPGMTIVSLSDGGNGRILVAGNYGPGCGASCKLGGIPLPQASSTSAFVAQIDSSNGAVASAKGFAMPQNTNSASGAIGLRESAGSVGGVVLLANTTGVDFGPPVGVLQSPNIEETISCLARMEP